MAHYDVFNGDADGLCALQQLRLSEARPDAQLITGIKREIRLLDRVATQAGDSVCVLDISLDSNRSALERILASGARVRYFDHHFAGDAPFSHPALEARIDTAAHTCTSLLVNQALGDAHPLWALAAAFGDNLARVARNEAARLGLDDASQDCLQTLGECLNYNGYGESLEDLWFHPAELYIALHPYADPRRFVAESSAWQKLYAGYQADRAQAEALTPLCETPAAAAFELPDTQWARRLSGLLANELARTHPARAHAVLTPAANGTYTVSVRAPQLRPAGADALCREFPGGGGRAGAAGINGLPAADLAHFIQRLGEHFKP